MDLINVDIKHIQFKKTSEKYKEQKINYNISYHNKKPTIRLEKVYIPFGVENFNDRQIINIEIHPKKHYNAYSMINGFENQLSNLENYSDKIVLENIQNKGYYKNMRKSKLGYIIRTHVFHKPEIFCNIAGFKTLMSTSDIKNTNSNVDLELGTFWINENNYGITWIVRKIEILNHVKQSQD